MHYPGPRHPNGRPACLDCGAPLYWGSGWCRRCWDENQALLADVYGHAPVPYPHPGPQQRRLTCVRGHQQDPTWKRGRPCRRDHKRRSRARAASPPASP